MIRSFCLRIVSGLKRVISQDSQFILSSMTLNLEYSGIVYVVVCWFKSITCTVMVLLSMGSMTWTEQDVNNKSRMIYFTLLYMFLNLLFLNYLISMIFTYSLGSISTSISSSPTIRSINATASGVTLDNLPFIGSASTEDTIV